MRMSEEVLPPASCQVYTPPRLAEAMVNALRKTESQTWLEPSCGKGVFLDAISNQCEPSTSILAVDLDTEPSSANPIAHIHRGVDFLEWSRDQRRVFDCVVGNPPFVSIRSLPEPLRSTAARVVDYDGKTIGLRSNTWYAFLLQSIRLVREGGSIAFVLPAACEYANYSRCGRSVLTKLFDRVDLIRSRKPLFDGVQEGSAVLVCRGKGGKAVLYRRHEVAGLDEVIQRLDDLDAVKARPCPNGIMRCLDGTVPLSEVMDVRLGGVTGDSAYFVISESQRRKHGLPRSAVQPILSRSRHVCSSMIGERDWLRLKADDERVWLFRPTHGSVKNESVRRYLAISAENGGCHRDRYKIKIRNPWYDTQTPSIADGFVTGMSSRGVWLCLNEMSGLNATNTLYVVSFRGTRRRSEKYAWALALLTTPAAKQIARSRRIYADGLKKIEPRQLGQIRLPVPPKLNNAVSLYRSAIDRYLNGEESAAHAIADKAILGREFR